MHPEQTQQPPPSASQREFAPKLEWSLLQADLLENQVIQACQQAGPAGLGSVILRPCDLDAGVRALGDSVTMPASVVGFPGGFETTPAKLFACRELLQRGARQIVFISNASKTLSRQFQYIEMELMQAADACLKKGALLTVVLDAALLSDELRIISTRICGRIGADFVELRGAGLSGVHFLRAKLPEEIRIAAEIPVDLEQISAFSNAGCQRFTSSDPLKLLALWTGRQETVRYTESD